MNTYRVLALAFIALLVLPTLSLVQASTAPQGYRDLLKRMGIDVPADRFAGEVRSFSTVIGRVEIQEGFQGYKVVAVDSSSPSRVYYMTVPGKPMLPYFTFTIIVDGRVDKASIYFEPLSVSEIRVDGRIAPAPQPLAYSPGHPNKLVITPDPSVYGKNAFFPGKVADVRVFHGLHGKSIIVVHVFPVQYNPVENKLVVVDDFRVSVYYTPPRIIPFASKSLLIITTPGLKDLVNDTLGDFYRGRGFNVTVVDTEYIYKHYTPAANITEYPGFYSPTSEDSIYNTLKSVYNYTLALKIISFLNSTYGNYSHVLLVGNAVDVPPSFYYQYYYWYGYLDPYNSWIPTDLFYADLDRDLVPDLSVGRIPFSNATLVNYTIHKIMAWYNTSAASGDTLVMAGGYPFGYAEMTGETELSTMVYFNETESFNTVMLTRTSYTYGSGSVMTALAGNFSATWFFLIAHGAGNEFADRIATPFGMYWETLATSEDILSLAPNAAVPVVSSVACENAAWDTDLVPPDFVPPSIGQAILLSPAGGIAYIGSARIAFELIGPFVFYGGIMMANLYGATFLHENIIAAYNDYRMYGIETTLGDVVANGIYRYVSVTSLMLGGTPYMEIATAEVMKLSLLGDPALELPVPKVAVEKPFITSIYGLNAVDYIDAGQIYYGDYGIIPFFKPSEPAQILLMGNGTTPVYVTEVRIFSEDYLLINHVLGRINTTALIDGVGLYQTVFNEYVSGKVVIKFLIPGRGEIRYHVLSAGVVVEPSRVVIGGTINIRGYGLDAFGVSEADIAVAGRTLAHVPVDPSTGSLEWSLALPYMAPGVYQVALIAPGVSSDILALMSGYVTVYSDEALSVKITAPSVAEAGETLDVYITTLYKGVPVNATLVVTVAKPDGSSQSLSLSPVSTGVYVLELNLTDTGAYRVEAVASYVTETTESYGYSSAVVTAVDRLYTIGQSLDEVKSLIEVLNQTIAAGATDIINEIKIVENKLVIIDTKLGEINGTLARIDNDVLAVNTTAGLILLKLSDLEDKITTGLSGLSSKIDSAKSEILSGQEEKASDIKDAITELGKNVTSDLSDVGKSVDQLTTIVEAMTAVAYILIIAAGVLAARRS